MRFQTLLTLVSAGTALSSAALADDLFVPSPEHPTLQAALDAAMDGDTIVLQAGTLTGPGNRNLTLPGIRLTFRGETGDPADVVWLGSDDSFITVGRGMTIESTGSSGTRFEGLTIRGFRSQGGGAFRVRNVDLVFDNCVIERNSGAATECFEGERGGAIDAAGGSIVFTDSVIRNNVTSSVVCGVGGSTSGGAIAASGTDLRFERCVIASNRANSGSGSASSSGGAISNAGTVTLIDTAVRGNQAFDGDGGAISASNVVAINCTFENNRSNATDSAAEGGAISATSATIINSTLINNRAGSTDESFRGVGGAISAGDLTMINSVLAFNSANSYGESEGGAISTSSATLAGVTLLGNSISSDLGKADEAIFADGGTITITNSVVDNGAAWIAGGSTPSVTWSCILGGFPGEGNIDADPMLDASFRPMPGSPVIDAGNTTLLPVDSFDIDGDGDTTEPIPLDLGGQPRVVDDPDTADTGVGSPVVDMGAHEFGSLCRADIDGDGDLTVFDFLEFGNFFDAGDPRADFDGDGELTLFDFLAFQDAFDAGCS